MYNDGAEREDALDLNVDGTKFRIYDPAMGKWWQIDPLANEGDLVSVTPYNYSYNNPVRYNDPDGDCPRCPRPQYRTAAAQHYSNMVRRDLVNTAYRYSNSPNPGRTVAGGARPAIEVGNHKNPQTPEGGLVTAVTRLGGQYQKFSDRLDVNVDKQEIFSTNGSGGQKSEGSKYVFSGPDAAKLEMMENTYQSSANAAYDEKFASFATAKTGVDFNSLSPEAQAEFKSQNSTVAPLLRSMVSMELGPSPKEQLLQQVKEMIRNGVMAPKVEVKPLPVIRRGN